MTDAEVSTAVGEFVRARRTELELTLRAVCEECGISVSYLSQIESGRKAASVCVLYRIATALKTSLSEMFSGIPAPKRKRK